MNALILALALSNPIQTDWADGYEWYKTNREPLPVVWMPVGQEGVKAYCGPPPFKGYNIFACAIYERETCLIIAELPEDQTPRWIVEHERKHCAGFNHLSPLPIKAF